MFFISDPVSNTIDSALKTSKAISELGILVVIAGIMLVIFVAMIIFIFKIMQNNNKKMLDSQTRSELQNEKIISQNEVIKGLLSKIADSESYKVLIEQSRDNSRRLLRTSFGTNCLDILSGVEGIIENNHIEDKNFTRERVSNVISVAHHKRIEFLNNYKYKGTQLGEFADTESWVSDKVAIAMKYIYSEKRNLKSLIRDLDLLYKKYMNQLKI